MTLFEAVASRISKRKPRMKPIPSAKPMRAAEGVGEGERA